MGWVVNRSTIHEQIYEKEITFWLRRCRFIIGNEEWSCGFHRWSDYFFFFYLWASYFFFFFQAFSTEIATYLLDTGTGSKGVDTEARQHSDFQFFSTLLITFFLTMQDGGCTLYLIRTLGYKVSSSASAASAAFFTSLTPHPSSLLSSRPTYASSLFFLLSDCFRALRGPVLRGLTLDLVSAKAELRRHDSHERKSFKLKQLILHKSSVCSSPIVLLPSPLWGLYTASFVGAQFPDPLS
jgi:hypothetical protein